MFFLTISEVFLMLKSSDWVVVILILIITFIATAMVRRFMNRFIKITSEKLNTDPTRYKFLKHLLTATISMVGLGLAIYSIPTLKALAISLFAGAGIIAVIVGFASQAAFSNIVSGIFIVLFKPFRLGDRINIAGNADFSGVVEDITLRHTVIRNYENRMVIMPNSIISNETVINSSIIDEKVCMWFELGISYDSDVDLAFRIIQEEAEQHPNLIDTRTAEDLANGVPKVVVRVMGYGDSSVNLRAWIWADDAPKGFVMTKDLYKTVKQSFDKEGVEIPFPYRTVVFKNQAPSGESLKNT